MTHPRFTGPFTARGVGHPALHRTQHGAGCTHHCLGCSQCTSCHVNCADLPSRLTRRIRTHAWPDQPSHTAHLSCGHCNSGWSAVTTRHTSRTHLRAALVRFAEGSFMFSAQTAHILLAESPIRARQRLCRPNTLGVCDNFSMSELNPCLPSFRRPPASRGCAFM